MRGRNIFAAALALCLAMVCALPAGAEAAPRTVRAQIWNWGNVTVEETPICFADETNTRARLLVWEGSVYLPLQTAGEWLGGTPEWDEAAGELRLSTGGEPYYRHQYLEQPAPPEDPESVYAQLDLDRANGVEVTLRPDMAVLLDGEEVSLADAQGKPLYPMVFRGVVYLPLRAVGELCGKQVLWFPDLPYLNLADLPQRPEELSRGMPGSPEDVLMPDILVFDSPTQEQLDGAASYLEQVEARVDNLVELAVTYRDTGEGRTVEETRALLEAIRAEADAIQVLSCPLPCLENGVGRPIGLYAKDISGNLVDRVCLPWLEVNPDASALEPESFARRMTAQLYEFFHLLDKGWAILESIQPAPAE